MGYLLGGHVVPAERPRVRGGSARTPRLRGEILEGVVPEADGARAGLDEPRRHSPQAAARVHRPWPPPITARWPPWPTRPDASSPCSSTPRWPTPPRARRSSTTSSAPRPCGATGPWPPSWTRRRPRSGAPSGTTGCSAPCPGGSTPPWWRCSSTRRSAISSPVSSSTMACSGAARRSGWSATFRRRLQDSSHPWGCKRPLHWPASGRHRSRGQAEGDRGRVHRRLRGRSAEARPHPVARPGDPLSRRHRVGLVQGARRPPSRPTTTWGAPEPDGVQAARAAAGAVQGRGARGGAPARAARRDHLAPAVPGAGARHPRPRRGDRGAPGHPARGRRRRPGRGAAGRARARAVAGVRRAPARAHGGGHGGFPHVRRRWSRSGP